MKKLLCLLLAALMTAGMFAGCGKIDVNNQVTEGTTVAIEDVTEELNDYTPDSVMRILMVGNSFCYYYVEELYELLMENPPEGIKAVEIYNLYYSGCSLSMHYTWWMKNESHYDLFKMDVNGRVNMNNVYQKWSLEQALAWADWDYISLQGSVVNGSYMNKSKREFTRNGIAEIAEPLLARFHELHPDAQLLWHRTWYSEIGRVGSDGYIYTAEGGPKYDEGMQDICDWMCNEFDKDKPYDLIQVNSGAAWTEARKLNETLDLLPYGGLCARLNYNKFGDNRANSGDGYHDGDIGGAQLLNAYIWYMTLTGNTDLTASKYMPVYHIDAIEFPLSKELVDMLKTAAMNVMQK